LLLRDDIPPEVSAALTPIVEHHASELRSRGGGGGTGTVLGLGKFDLKSLI
jgi:hypothetical protein